MHARSLSSPSNPSLPSSPQGVFRCPDHAHREDHIASRGRMAQIITSLTSTPERPFLFILNFQVPGDPPLSLPFIFALPSLDGPSTDSPAPLLPFLRTLRRFVDFSDAHSNSTDSQGSHVASQSGSEGGSRSAASSVTSGDDAERANEEEEGEGIFPLTDFKNKRFKLIPTIVEGPSVVRWAVGSKPAILGQKVRLTPSTPPLYTFPMLIVAHHIGAFAPLIVHPPGGIAY